MGFPTSGLFEGFVRAHSDGRRWKWRASKGVWQIKHTAKSEAELVGDTGADGADGVAPAGSVVMWSGAVSAIPSGWYLCDGNNGTPNLMGKFIKGSTTAGGTGGSTSHSHSHSLSAGSHTLSAAQMPSHNHTESGWYGAHRAHYFTGNNLNWTSATIGFKSLNTGSKGSSSSHSHSLAGSIANGSNEPPYYELCYIMKT